MNTEFYCLHCESSDKIRLDLKYYSDDYVEVYLKCDCGHEESLGFDGDRV